jgi:sugar phosphate isomerase/epimerase
MTFTRRDFLRNAAAAGAALATAHPLEGLLAQEKGRFGISLAEWSLHRTLRAGTITNLDFPRVAKNDFGITAIEYVNQFFKDQARDMAYLKDLKSRTETLGVKNVLIMVDGEGMLGHPEDAERVRTVENHKKWVEAAKFLGCHAIRVNAQSKGTREEQERLAADGLRSLGEFAAPHDISVIVENHGGLSSDGSWLAAVIRRAQLPNVGTLPDFGNFRVSREQEYDRYKGVAELMPFAKGVSAKSHDFDAAGNETGTDYAKMLDIVITSSYRGFIGIEYEGQTLGEYDGIKATKALLERVLKGYL